MMLAEMLLARSNGACIRNCLPAWSTMMDSRVLKRLVSSSDGSVAEQSSSHSTDVASQAESSSAPTPTGTRRADPYRKHALMVTNAQSWGELQTPLRACTCADVARLLNCSPDNVRVRYNGRIMPNAFYVLYDDKEARDQALHQAQRHSRLGSTDVNVVPASREEVQVAQSHPVTYWLAQSNSALPGGSDARGTGRPSHSAAHMALVTSTHPVTKEQLLQAYQAHDLIPPYATPHRPNKEESAAPSASSNRHVLFFGSEAAAVRAACDRQAILALGAGQTRIRPLQ